MKCNNITILGDPRTKKNSPRLIWIKGFPKIIPSKAFVQYQKDCGWQLKKNIGIDYPINLKCVYYMKTKRKVDLTNLNSSICDILVYYKVIADDNSKIVVSMDGSRVRYDKSNPRVEIEILEVHNE